MSNSVIEKEKIWDVCDKLWEQGEAISSAKVLAEMGYSTSKEVLRQISAWKQARMKKRDIEPLPRAIIDTMEQMWLHLQWQADHASGEEETKAKKAIAECNRMAGELSVAQENIRRLTEALHGAQRNADRFAADFRGKIEYLEAQLANEQQLFQKYKRYATAEKQRLTSQLNQSQAAEEAAKIALEKIQHQVKQLTMQIEQAALGEKKPNTVRRFARKNAQAGLKKRAIANTKVK
jgi:murein DD-endopeptidase MepM/ murein hydrolase activator NlpD